MPTARIDYSIAQRILKGEYSNSEFPGSPEDNIISTPFGLSLLEIQGDLNLPIQAPTGVTEVDLHSETIQNFIKVDEIYDAVKCGHLQFDPLDPSRVTLFIGKSQRLLGSVVKIDPPLAVLRIPLKDGEEKNMDIVDIVSKKLIFKQRPLPIM